MFTITDYKLHDRSMTLYLAHNISLERQKAVDSNMALLAEVYKPIICRNILCNNILGRIMSIFLYLQFCFSMSPKKEQMNYKIM